MLEAMPENATVLVVEDSVCPLSVALHDVPDGRPDSVNVTVYVEGGGGGGDVIVRVNVVECVCPPPLPVTVIE